MIEMPEAEIEEMANVAWLKAVRMIPNIANLDEIGMVVVQGMFKAGWGAGFLDGYRVKGEEEEA